MKYNIIISVIIILVLFYNYFNRQPVRITNLPLDIIVSPADGVVKYANNRIISIFLNIFNVHCQYVPINSYVKDIIIISGTYNLANTPESGHNEGIKVIFESNFGEIEVIQRVGFFVRRIQNTIKKNEYVERNKIYGKINFGSRVDIKLPEGFVTNLIVGQKIYGGITPII
tara:strand:+ start:239 stop:751 length:513 start_codon:yes stop_codon:yes gene_type:complete